MNLITTDVDAQSTAYTAGVDRPSVPIAVISTSYGVGATISPLIATAFVSSGHLFRWFYAILLGVSCLNISLVLYAFRLQPELEDSAIETIPLPNIGASATAEIEAVRDPISGPRVSQHAPLSTVLKNRVMLTTSICPCRPVYCSWCQFDLCSHSFLRWG